MKNLKFLRKSLNMTLQQLSDELGTSPQVLSRYERGEHQADYNTLAKIARFFNVSIDYLLGATKDEIVPKGKSSPELTSEEQSLLNDFRSLPRQERAQASEYVHYLADRRGNKNA